MAHGNINNVNWHQDETYILETDCPYTLETDCRVYSTTLVGDIDALLKYVKERVNAGERVVINPGGISNKSDINIFDYFEVMRDD